MLRDDILGDLAHEVTLANRFGGGYDAATATVIAAGTTVVVAVGAGSSINVAWVSAIADPGADDNPLITVSLGGVPIYHGYAIAHWELFEGPDGGDLTVTTDVAVPVAVTVHYKVVA